MSDNIEGEQKKNRNELAKLFNHTYLKAYASCGKVLSYINCGA